MIFVILFGALIGTQYRVAILVPCTLVAVFGSATIDRIHHFSLSSMILTAVGVTIALQIGYVAGAALRLVLRTTLFPSTTGAGAARG